MRILLLGINHRTAPLELREKLAPSDAELSALHDELSRRYPMSEHVVIATCNRMELYIARPTHEPPTADDLRALLAEHASLPVERITAASIQREQDTAVRHLFHVCAGLDSMVLGEPQVLGQVKRAYDAAMTHNAVGPVLHRVFQDAIGAAKKARTQTGIGEGRVSVGSVAVDFARQVFEDFTDKTILGIGAGEMAKTTLTHLRGLSPQRLWVVNRSSQRAEQLVASLQLAADIGGARPWEDLDELLVRADIVLTSTGSNEPLLTTDRFKPIIKRRRGRPLFVIDIALPRDVQPEVGALSNVYLYNIDDLQTVVEANVEQRRDQIAACEAQLGDAVGACMHQIQHRDVGQLIRQLRQRLHAIGDIEQQRTQRKLRNVTDDATADALDELMNEHTRRLVNKILHLPLSQLDQKSGDTSAPLGFYAAALRRLFDLDDTPPADRTEPTETKRQSTHT